MDKEPRARGLNYHLIVRWSFLFQLHSLLTTKDGLMDTEGLIMPRKIVITSTAIHYSLFFFFSGLLRTDEKKRLCVCRPRPRPAPLKLRAQAAFKERPPSQFLTLPFDEPTPFASGEAKPLTTGRAQRPAFQGLSADPPGQSTWDPKHRASLPPLLTSPLKRRSPCHPQHWAIGDRDFLIIN